MEKYTYRTQAAHETLTKILKYSFKAGDIAEILPSADSDSSAEKALDIIEKSGLDAAGIKKDGRYAGWVSRKDCQDNAGAPCLQFMRQFSEKPVLTSLSSFQDVILSLSANNIIFVSSMGEVSACISMRNIQDASMRMWLFGLISLMETLMYRGIRSQMPGDSWKEYITPSRLARTEGLWEERMRRGETIALVDCLQFADKADILLRNPVTSNALQFVSRRKGQEYFSHLENLRNNVVHSQMLTESNIPIITSLALTLDILLDVDREPLVSQTDKPMEDFRSLTDRIREYSKDNPALASLPGIATPPPTPKGKLPPQKKAPKVHKEPKTPEAAAKAAAAAERMRLAKEARDAAAQTNAEK